MEYSPHLKFYQDLQKRGRPSPLDDVPEIGVIATWYLDVFRILNSGRQELNQIPLQDIFSYIEHFDIVGSKEEFIEIIQEMDSVFLDYYNKQREQKQKRVKKRG